jgi:Tol biopolymer transport system component
MMEIAARYRRGLAISQSAAAGVLLIIAACGGATATTATSTTPTAPPARFALTSAAELVAPDVVSSENTEIRLAASPDGQMVLWGSPDRKGGPGGWNIWMSRKAGAGWGAATPVAFNSDANDFDPAFSPDGAFVYFFSNRPGGAGGDDIYRVAVTAVGFGAVERLGPEINTPGDEWAPSLSPDGKRLLFASNRPGNKHDLYTAEVRGQGFAPAQPLAGAINTAADEFDATFLADGSSIVFARSADVENDPIQLFVAVRGASGYDAGTRLSDAVNVVGGYTLGPTIDWRDRQILYFSGARAEAKRGKLDVYRVHYTLTGP